MSGINYNQIFRSIKNLASSQDTLDFYFNKTFRELVTKRKNKIYINLSSFKDLNDEMKMKVLENMKTVKEFDELSELLEEIDDEDIADDNRLKRKLNDSFNHFNLL